LEERKIEEMSKFIIHGGAKLGGNVKISGAKNEVLKLIPLSILLDKPTTISNAPHILDVKRQLEIFKQLGGSFSFNGDKLILDGRNISKTKLDPETAGKLRASLVYMGPLLARFGSVSLPTPGGCQIGSRPIDAHIDSFCQLGAKISNEKECIKIELSKPCQNKVNLSKTSVSATENILLYCSAINQTTTITNCAIEPEIVELEKKLVKAGADISGIGAKKITVTGCKRLSIDTIEVMSDRIEAATFVVAFLSVGGEGTVSPYPKDNLKAFNNLLKKIGADVEIKKSVAYVKSGPIKPFRISTSPHPGFPTDLQSPISLLAARANGTSVIEERVWENRLMYIEQLKKMGLKAKLINAQKVEITGPAQLKATKIVSLDLRSGITMLLAGLMADGKTVLDEAEIIDRGYENIEKKLRLIGAKIERVK